ncbi:UNVERIFIED_CONTAM: AT-hook motif nuclear-localized protein 1 [Sesamum calycinum]|uniref:AT-hook motif nuclear-localized protein n=1 Tax=Sesamum calycinum TaxID=2727403 RepID=A0AAW2NWC4_9LAMI
MDSAKAMASGVTVVAPGAPSSYQMTPRTENLEPGSLPMASPLMVSGSERKKRGRPRKYKPDESTSRVLSPVPLSSSAPPATGKSYVEEKKPTPARPVNSEKNIESFCISLVKFSTASMGTVNGPRYGLFSCFSSMRSQVLLMQVSEDWGDCFTGSSFLPHVITVNSGEDISTKIMEFSLQGPRTVCVISGSGTVSNVTIRHPSSSGGTLTYEGLFEILSFSGSFTPVEMPDSKFGRSGMMAISLSGADGRVVGGLIAGLTIAASPVKVVVASFLLGSPFVPKPRKLKTETAFTVDASGPNSAPATNVDKRVPNETQRPSCSASENPTNWAAGQVAERSRKSTADINISLQGVLGKLSIFWHFMLSVEFTRETEVKLIYEIHYQNLGHLQ